MLPNEGMCDRPGRSAEAAAGVVRRADSGYEGPVCCLDRPSTPAVLASPTMRVTTRALVLGFR